MEAARTCSFVVVVAPLAPTDRVQKLELEIGRRSGTRILTSRCFSKHTSARNGAGALSLPAEEAISSGSYVSGGKCSKTRPDRPSTGSPMLMFHHFYSFSAFDVTSVNRALIFPKVKLSRKINGHNIAHDAKPVQARPCSNVSLIRCPLKLGHQRCGTSLANANVQRESAVVREPTANVSSASFAAGSRQSQHRLNGTRHVPF